MIPTCNVANGPRVDGIAPSCGEPAAFFYGSYHVCAEHASVGKYHDNPRHAPYEDLTPINPYVGMPCTIQIGSDRYAATVVFVSSKGTKIVVREDTAIRTDDNGMSESQTYRFEPNPAGQEHDFFRPRLPQEHPGLMVWGRQGKALVLGERSAYHDYSF